MVIEDPGERISVLHVDDDSAFLDLTKTFLEQKDGQFSVETATTVGEALTVLDDHQPDCVLSDYEMPGTDGIEFLREVRERHPDLPFILFTAKGSEQVASDAIAAGVTDYLKKRSGSEQYDLLSNRIENAVRARRQAREADRREVLMRLTEYAGDTGGWELNVETEDLRLTDGARRLLGHPESSDRPIEEVIDVSHPDADTSVEEAVERVAETGESTNDTWHVQTPDGDDRVFDITIIPATNDETVTTLRGAIRDVTDIRQRQHELDQIETLFEHAQDALFLLDASDGFAIERVNPAWENATGLSAEAVRGRTLSEVFDDDSETMEHKFRECARTREPLQYEQSASIDGETTHWRTKIAPVVVEGTVEQIAGSTRNVTEQKRRRSELAAERQFIQQSLDALEDLFYVLDVDGSLRRWNEQIPAVSGYGESELADMSVGELVADGRSDSIRDAIETALDDERATVETDLCTADGDRIPYEFTNTRLTDADGDTTGVVGIGRDLTERKRRERRFRALVEQSNDIVSVVDREGRYQYQSPSLERILGYDPEETIGDAAWEYIHPDDHDTVRSRFEQIIDESAAEPAGPIEYRARHADGSWRWMESQGNGQFDNPAVGGYVVNSRDVTERRARQRQLEKEKRTVDSIFRGLPDVLYTFDMDGYLLRWNDQLERETGYSPAEIEEMHVTDFVPDGEEELIGSKFQTVLQEQESVTIESAFETKDGDRVPFEFTGAPLEDADGSLRGMTGIGRNVSGRKERERRFEAVFENTYQFTGLMAPDGTLLELNRTAEEFIGRDRRELIGEKLWETEPFQMMDSTRRVVEESVETARAGELFQDQITVRGSERDAVIDFSVRPVTDEDGNVDLLIPEGRDITRLSQREQQFRVTNRFLRHNIRNKLNLIIGHGNQIREATGSEIRSSGEAIVRIAGDVIENADTAREIHELVQADPDPDVVELRAQLGRAVEIARRDHQDAEIVARCVDNLEIISLPSLDQAFTKLLGVVLKNATTDTPTARIETRAADTAQIAIRSPDAELYPVEQDILTGNVELDQLTHAQGLDVWYVYWNVWFSGGRISTAGASGDLTVHLPLAENG